MICEGKQNRLRIASGGGEMGLTGKGHEGNVWGDGNDLYLERVIPWLVFINEYISSESFIGTHQLLHFIVCQFYSRKNNKQILNSS